MANGNRLGLDEENRLFQANWRCSDLKQHETVSAYNPDEVFGRDRSLEHDIVGWVWASHFSNVLPCGTGPVVGNPIAVLVPACFNLVPRH